MATFDEAAGAFDLSASAAAGLGDVLPGRYRLLAAGRDVGDDHLYRLGHPLAQTLVDHASARSLPPAEVVFDYAGHGVRVSLVEALQGQAGYLRLPLLTIRWRVE